MSYDTTVHDAIDPPLPRVRQSPEEKTRREDSRRRLPRAWRSVLITTITVGLAALVTWGVAAVARWPSQHPPDATVVDAPAQAAFAVGPE